jgi:hypothetical protein
MSEFEAMQDAIEKQYGFDAWSDAAAPHFAAPGRSVPVL